MMKILLTGKNGQLGFELQRSLAPLGEVFAVDRQTCPLHDEVALQTLLEHLQPDVIVNAAAYTAVDRAEGDAAAAFAVNARGAEILGQHAARTGALVVHYSTDYVFDGSKDGAYGEADPVNPQSVYGASKLAGEQALQASEARHLILRTSWVFGAHGGNFAKTMLRLAAEREQLGVVADQFGAPTSAALLADVSAHLLREATGHWRGAFPYGVYHLAAGGVTNWHEYACCVIEAARAAGLPIRAPLAHIRPLTTSEYPTPAKRPANSRLDTRKLRQTFGLHLPNWQQGLNHVLQQIFQSP